MLKKIASFRSVFLNGLILSLSIAVLAAVTFAWFSAEKSSGSAKTLPTGTFAISLGDQETSLKYTNEDNISYVEPGGTYTLEDVTLTNNGTVALKYKVEVVGLGEITEFGTPVITVDGDAYSEGTVLSASDDDVISVSLKIPDNVTEFTNDKLPSLSLKVTAIQASSEQDSTGSSYDAGVTFDNYK